MKEKYDEKFFDEVRIFTNNFAQPLFSLDITNAYGKRERTAKFTNMDNFFRYSKLIEQIKLAELRVVKNDTNIEINALQYLLKEGNLSPEEKNIITGRLNKIMVNSRDEGR